MILYEIISPSGKSYIGITKRKIEDRWSNHVSKALNNPNYNHPFYNAIRKYGKDSFTLKILRDNLTEEEAKKAEIEEISRRRLEGFRIYNISRGGEYDGADGSRIFWDKITKDKEAYDEYRKKLSIKAKSRSKEYYEGFFNKSEEWKRSHPKQVYKTAYRASRLALRAKGDFRNWFERNPPEGRIACLKSRRVQWTKKMWENRSEEQRKSVGRSISVSLKRRNAGLSREQKEAANKQLSKARKNINVSLRSQRVREAYAKLKADPEKWEAYLRKRKESRDAKKSV